MPSSSGSGVALLLSGTGHVGWVVACVVGGVLGRPFGPVLVCGRNSATLGSSGAVRRPSGLEETVPAAGPGACRV
jgi:hypothetical protein